MIPFLKKKLSPEHRTLLLRQLAMLCANGLTVAQAIQHLAQKNESKAVRTHCRTQVEKNPGQPGLEQTIDPLLGYTIARLSSRAATPQELACVLHDMADIQETTAHYSGSLKAALTYPLTVFFACFITCAILLVFVIPVFENLFSGFGASLPGPTKEVLAISNWVQSYGIYLFPGLAALVVLFKVYPLSQLPFLWLFKPLNTVVKNVAAIQFSQLFAALLKFGLPLGEAFQMTAQSIAPTAYGLRLRRLGLDVNDLGDFKAVVKSTRIFPESMVAVIDLLDQTEALFPSFFSFSEYLRRGFEARLNKTYRTIEVTAFMAVALVVGGMVIAMYLPIFKMAGAIGG